MAVILGASTVSQAVDRLDTLNRVADVDRLVIGQTRIARKRYRGETRALSSRERSLAALTAQAAATADSLAQARAQRASYLAGLAARRQANASLARSAWNSRRRQCRRAPASSPPSPARAEAVARRPVKARA